MQARPSAAAAVDPLTRPPRISTGSQHLRRAATRLAAVAFAALLTGCDGLGPVATENLTSPCPDGSQSSARTMGVGQSQVNIRVGPGTSYERVVDQRRSRESSVTAFASLKPGLTVLEECSKDGWSRVWVTEPAHLRASHHGWVVSRFLSEVPASAAKRVRGRHSG